MTLSTCVFCLSKERNLIFINESPFHFIYSLFDNDDAQYLKELNREGRLRVCSYCQALTRKLAKFAATAQQSVQTLRAYLVTQNELLPKSQHNLCITQVEAVDIAPLPPGPPSEAADEEGDGNIIFTQEQQIKDDIKEETNSSGDDCDHEEDGGQSNDYILSQQNEVIKQETINKPEVKEEAAAKKKTFKRKNKKSLLLAALTLPAKKSEALIKENTDDKETVHSVQQVVGGAGWSERWACNARASRWYAAERAAEPRAEGALACALCRRHTFADAGQLARHAADKHHESAGALECDVCRFRFRCKRALARHVARHCRVFACSACPHEARSRAQARRHAAQHASSAPAAPTAPALAHAHSCRRCKDTFPTFALLRSHKASCATYKCEQCDKTFGDKCRYFKHVPVHKEANSKDKLYCQVCDRQFTSPQWFRTHFRTSLKHVSRDSFQHECPHCQMRFHIAQRLKEHVAAKHLNRGLYACDLCPKSFTVNSSLRKHRAREHDIGAVRAPLRDKICDHCGKAFTSNHLLNNHVRLHTGEKPFTCALCPAAFAQNGTLYMHTLTVHRKRLTKDGATDCTDAAPFQCEECGKGFWSSSQQKAHHKLAHLKQSNFICEVCNKMFASSSHLKNHLAGRHGVLYSDSFKCDSCGKRFNTPSALRVHEKTHLAVEDSVHKCRACDAAFRNSGQLYMHFKLKHLKLKRSDKVSLKNISNPDRELIVNGKPQ